MLKAHLRSLLPRRAPAGPAAFLGEVAMLAGLDMEAQAASSGVSAGVLASLMPALTEDSWNSNQKQVNDLLEVVSRGESLVFRAPRKASGGMQMSLEQTVKLFDILKNAKGMK